MSQPIPVIQIGHLAKSFGRHQAVKDVSFTVNRGDIFGFLGRNGAGKSTTIRAMLTLIRPDAGDVKIFGLPLQANRSEILRKIGCIVEKPDFYKYLSGLRNLEIAARLSGMKISNAKIDEMLDFVGLKGRGGDRVSGYSHGMRQRLGIAQALIHDPELIVLDEPTTGLDPQGIIDIRNLILRLKNELGKTVILSSHLLAEVELICNRMVIIDRGRSLVEGSVHELLNADEVVVEFQTDKPEMAAAILKGHSAVKQFEQRGHNLSVLMHHRDIAQINAALVQGGVAVSAIESKRKLEDYFLRILESENE